MVVMQIIIYQVYGCGYTSAAIILSMYGVDMNPQEVYEASGTWSDLIATKCGVEKQVRGSFGDPASQLSSSDQEYILNWLLAGNPAILFVLKSAGTSLTGASQHYVALLDVDDSKTQVYISNPWDGGRPTGWIDTATLFHGAVGVYLFRK